MRDPALSGHGPVGTFCVAICELFHEVPGSAPVPSAYEARSASFTKVTIVSTMLRNYLPVLMLLGFVIVNAVLILGIAHMTVPAQPTAVKSQPYESGIAPVGDARGRFSVKFYVVAMLFIVFDIETVFMIPWGVQFRQLSCTVPMMADTCPAGHLSFFGLAEMLMFAAILIVGFVYVWRKGALSWD